MRRPGIEPGADRYRLATINFTTYSDMLAEITWGENDINSLNHQRRICTVSGFKYNIYQRFCSNTYRPKLGKPPDSGPVVSDLLLSYISFTSSHVLNTTYRSDYITKTLLLLRKLSLRTAQILTTQSCLFPKMTLQVCNNISPVTS